MDDVLTETQRARLRRITEDDERYFRSWPTVRTRYRAADPLEVMAAGRGPPPAGCFWVTVIYKRGFGCFMRKVASSCALAAGLKRAQS